MILRDIGWGGMYWIDLIYDKGQWKALVIRVTNLMIQQIAGKYLRIP
jgi:hypothetical protein